MSEVKVQKSLAPMWDAILNVYKEFARICERHNFRFYLIDGSAIGAVRHQGFIPWDDDLDVAMPREDYEEFLKVAPQELPSHLKTITIDNTPGYYLLFGKIQETRRDVVEAIEHKVGYTLSNGIFIDIFPIDGYDYSRFRLAFTKVKVFILTLIDHYVSGSFTKYSWRGKIAWALGFFMNTVLFRVKDQVQMAHAYERCYGKKNFSSYEWTSRVQNWRHRRLFFPKDVWGTAKTGLFCGLSVPLPEKYDTYLGSVYGNYMKLPPEEKRKTTHSYDGFHVSWWLGPTGDTKK